MARKSKDLVITEQHHRFVDEYLKTDDVYSAARNAGVAEHMLDEAVAKWRDHPTILAMIEYKRMSDRAEVDVTAAWIKAELLDCYARARDERSIGKAVDILDKLGKHVGFYAADKAPATDHVPSVTIINYAGASNGPKLVSE